MVNVIACQVDTYRDRRIIVGGAANTAKILVVAAYVDKKSVRLTNPACILVIRVVRGAADHHVAERGVEAKEHLIGV